MHLIMWKLNARTLSLSLLTKETLKVKIVNSTTKYLSNTPKT